MIFIFSVRFVSIFIWTLWISNFLLPYYTLINAYYFSFDIINIKRTEGDMATSQLFSISIHLLSKSAKYFYCLLCHMKFEEINWFNIWKNNFYTLSAFKIFNWVKNVTTYFCKNQKKIFLNLKITYISYSHKEFCI